MLENRDDHHNNHVSERKLKQLRARAYQKLGRPGCSERVIKTESTSWWKPEVAEVIHARHLEDRK